MTPQELDTKVQPELERIFPHRVIVMRLTPTILVIMVSMP